MDQPRIDGWHAPPAREPMFNAPWTIVAIAGLLIALYAAQSVLVTPSQELYFGLTPQSLAQGRWETLLTSIFLHGSWPHVLMNSVAIIAFGSPATRLMGTGPRGASVFFAFYLVCGVISGLGVVVCEIFFVDPTRIAPVVGASGAASGLAGAASRLIQGHGRVGSMFSSTVIGMAAAWALANTLLGVSGLTPGAEGIPVAWQAHLAGYAAGVLLIGPFVRLAGAGPDDFTQ